MMYPLLDEEGGITGTDVVVFLVVFVVLVVEFLSTVADVVVVVVVLAAVVVEMVVSTLEVDSVVSPEFAVVMSEITADGETVPSVSTEQLHKTDKQQVEISNRVTAPCFNIVILRQPFADPAPYRCAPRQRPDPRGRCDRMRPTGDK